MIKDELLVMTLVRDALNNAGFWMPNTLGDGWLNIIPHQYLGEDKIFKSWLGELKFLKSKHGYKIYARLDYLGLKNFRLENPNFPNNLIRFVSKSWNMHLNLKG